MAVFVGIIIGAFFYCATAFPVALLTGAHGEVWGGACMLYGVVCGFVGVAVAHMHIE